jgi:hypothetical protein
MFLLECTIVQNSHNGSVDFNILVGDGGTMHYNKRGVYCDPNIIANNKEKSL